jgi:tol-pal system protein YbgF
MMKTTFKKQKTIGLGLLLFSFVFISSCVYDKEFTYLNDQIIALNKRVTRLQESVDEKLETNIETRMKSIHSSQAEIGAEMDQLKREMQGFSGRVEDNEQIIKRAVERDLSEQDAMRLTLVDLSQKVTELETLVKRQHEYLGLAAKGVPGGQEQVMGAPGQKGTGPVRPEVSGKPKSPELELYETSLAAYKNGKYEEATEGFKDLLKRYPNSDRADNAQFWIGECHMALKHYEQAILSYQKVIKTYPKGNKVPSAMLRQAIAFLEIKDRTSTKLLLKRIISKYPNSSEAKIAQKKLETLK